VDADDYLVVERASARTIAACTLWLPGCSALWACALYFNNPPLKQLDDSLDILQHKIEEFMEKGKTYKEAVQTLKRFLVGKTQRRRLLPWFRRCERAARLCQLVNLISLVVLSSFLNGDNAEIIISPASLIIFVCLLVKNSLEYLVMPMLLISRTVEASTKAESPQEKQVRLEIDEIIGTDDSSSTQDTSTEYSSANESFLDEDPRSEALPSVLGVRAAKVIVRPKAIRLRLRFQLQQNIPRFNDYVRQWRREDPYRHGRLLHVPKKFPHVFPKSRTVSFFPTDESDWPLKATKFDFRCRGMSHDTFVGTKAFLHDVHRKFPRQFGHTEACEAYWQSRGMAEPFGPMHVSRFGFKRSHSLGTLTARELPEWRAKYEAATGFCDIVEERFSSGVPKLPADGELQARGLVDEFELQGVFRQVTDEFTNKDMFLQNPWKNTKTADRMARLARCLGGPEIEKKPWETTFDEELEEYGGEGEAGKAESARRAKRREDERAEALRAIADGDADDEGHSGDPEVDSHPHGHDSHHHR
jgi:hypothetical protein